MLNKTNRYLSIRYLPVYLVFLSLILFATRTFSAATQSPIEISNLHKVTAIIFALLILAPYATLKRIFWVPEQKCYFVYILAGFVSTLLYSGWFLYSIWKLTEVFTAFLLSIYIMSCEQRSNHTVAADFYELIVKFLKFLVVMTLIGVFVNPHEAIRSPLSEESLRVYGAPLLPYALYGTIIQINSNSLGVIGAIILMICVVRILNGRRSINNYSWLMTSAAILLFAQSRTAWIGFLLSLSVVLTFSNIGRVKKVVFILAILATLAFFSTPFYQYLTRGYQIERMMTMSGRTIWWEIALGEFADADYVAQVIGLGFMTANRVILAEHLDAEGASTLHSDYIDAMISTGFLGLTMLVLAAVLLTCNILRATRRKADNGTAIELLGVWVILLVRTITGTTIASHNIFLLVFFAIVVYGATLRINHRGTFCEKAQ